MGIEPRGSADDEQRLFFDVFIVNMSLSFSPFTSFLIRFFLCDSEAFETLFVDDPKKKKFPLSLDSVPPAELEKA